MEASDCLGGGLGAIANDVVTIKCLEPLFVNIVNTVIALSGIALFIMIVYSGFNFLFSGGDPKKLEQARQGLTFAIIGLVIIASAYLIIRTISAFTGVKEILKFNIVTTNNSNINNSKQNVQNKR